MTHPHATRTLETELGPLLASASPEGLTALLWNAEQPVVHVRADGDRHIDQFVEELGEYLAGARRSFTVALDPAGTPFQLQVWRALTGIPYGETRTYGAQAEAVGRPSAVRAVAAANGRNPLSIVVPCHRVIGANGSLTGYAGGLEVKRRLLELEGALPPALF